MRTDTNTDTALAAASDKQTSAPPTDLDHVAWAEPEPFDSPDVEAAEHIWQCPVCASRIHHPYRPGRRRVYCTNACRQRAYRWRRARRPQLQVRRPVQRARSREGIHALRSDRDFVTSQRSPHGKRITACGTFAEAARDHPRRFAHTEFHPSRDSCRTCRAVLGLAIREDDEILLEIFGRLVDSRPADDKVWEQAFMHRVRRDVRRAGISPGATSRACRDTARSPSGP